MSRAEPTKPFTHTTTKRMRGANKTFSKQTRLSPADRLPAPHPAMASEPPERDGRTPTLPPTSSGYRAPTSDKLSVMRLSPRATGRGPPGTTHPFHGSGACPTKGRSDGLSKRHAATPQLLQILCTYAGRGATVSTRWEHHRHADPRARLRGEAACWIDGAVAVSSLVGWKGSSRVWDRKPRGTQAYCTAGGCCVVRVRE